MTKEEISVINTITVPQGMENEAEAIRDQYVAYFKAQQGFVSSSFYRCISREEDGALRYVNIVVWSSYEAFEKVVNLGFQNADGENKDGMRVLGKGFPEPIVVSPGQFVCIDHTS
jgi:heme-degrading monooxygenase HmoA